MRDSGEREAPHGTENACISVCVMKRTANRTNKKERNMRGEGEQRERKSIVASSMKIL